VPGAGSLTMSPNDAVARAAWWQRGAAADPQQLNRYSYASNNPLKYTDPSGHCIPGPLLVCVVAAGAFILLAGATIATSPQSGANLGDVDWS
jgi:hypothetical protein